MNCIQSKDNSLYEIKQYKIQNIFDGTNHHFEYRMSEIVRYIYTGFIFSMRTN